MINEEDYKRFFHHGIENTRINTSRNYVRMHKITLNIVHANII